MNDDQSAGSAAYADLPPLPKNDGWARDGARKVSVWFEGSVRQAQREAATAAVTALLAQIQEGAGMTWQPISTAPEGVPVMCGWLDDEDPQDPERTQMDVLEDGVWQVHHDTYEHYRTAAPAAETQPMREAPPYTWWLKLQPIPGRSPSLPSETAASVVLAEPAEDGWFPIAQAPRDGTEVWAFNGEQARMLWSQGKSPAGSWALWVWADPLLADADPSPEQPTYFRPLPAPPGAAASVHMEGTTP